MRVNLNLNSVIVSKEAALLSVLRRSRESFFMRIIGDCRSLLISRSIADDHDEHLNRNMH
jgi:hypothetical protein